jgi:CheY-like chemotaxis protein
MSTIVIIEDDAAIRKFVTVNLRARGHTVIEAADGQQGLAVLYSNRPNLVLLDNSMPGMSGVELAREISVDQSLAGIPLVLLTGSGRESLGDLSDLPIISGVLMKPISVDDLLDVVAEYQR